MPGRMLRQTVLWLLIQAALLFGPARTLGWPAGWALLLLIGGGGLAIGFWLSRHDPGLLAERLRSPLRAGQRPRDAILLAAIGVAWCGWLAGMGWDARRHGFSAMPPALQAAGAVSMLLGLWIAWRALAANSFASGAILVQPERGHRVIDSGAYARVRHPMYSGALLLILGMPLLLGSWWGLAGGVVFAAAIALRAGWEEAALRTGLPGYADYAQRVRYRFVPNIW